MTKEEFEKVFLHSLDATIAANEQVRLHDAIEGHRPFQQMAKEFTTLRELIIVKDKSSFGPFFAERVTHYIKNIKSEIDYQIFSFFKKYQLAALGIVVALVIANLFQSEQSSIASFLGFEDNNSLLNPSDFFTSISN
ncbi:MAG: hypothetical protein ACKO13_13255 [Cytophagales bacterium]